VQVFEDKIKLMHAFSDLSYTFDYSLMEPLFNHTSKEVNRITIIFSEKYEQELRRFERRLFNKEDLSFTRSSIRHIAANQKGPLELALRFPSRANRDVFLYTIKAFITKREIKNTAVIRKIEKINFDDKEEFSAIQLVHELRRDLVRYDRAYKKMVGEKRRHEDESRTHSSISYVRRDEPSTSGKISQLERENESLNGRIRSLVQEIGQLKVASTASHHKNLSQPQINFRKKTSP
jgi:hypothetical protein